MEESGSSVKSLSIVNFIFGVRLIISPYLLSYDVSQAKWQQTVAGAVVVIMSAVRFFAPSQLWASWVNVLAGIWMIIAPFATNYKGSASYWNEVIFGVLIALVGLGNTMKHPSGQQHGSGHYAS